MPRCPQRYALALLQVALFSWAVTAQPAEIVSVTADRESALYEVGETVTFTIQVARDNQPLTTGDVLVELSNDGANTIATETFTLTGEAHTISGTLPNAGFLRCTATYAPEGTEKIIGLAAVGLSPLEIKPSLPVPEDFDTFWAGKRAHLNTIPMNPQLTPVESGQGGIEAFDVQLDCAGGAPLSGYYCKPTSATEKSLPALLYVHGAGVNSSALRPELAAEGLLVLDINAHGIANGQPKEFYEALAAGRLKNYRLHGRDDRETYYFLGMYYRLMRAIDFLTAQPEWDGKTLIVRGSSQGGGQSIVAAGLDPRVTAIFPGVPAMCEHTGTVFGWPKLVPRDKEGKLDPKIAEVARYYDAMNFATRTQAEALVSVGFIDNTCRPTSVYAMYNNLPGKKEIFNMPLMAHKNAPEWDGMVLEGIRRHIAR